MHSTCSTTLLELDVVYLFATFDAETFLERIAWRALEGCFSPPLDELWDGVWHRSSIPPGGAWREERRASGAVSATVFAPFRFPTRPMIATMRRFPQAGPRTCFPSLSSLNGGARAHIRASRAEIARIHAVAAPSRRESPSWVNCPLPVELRRFPPNSAIAAAGQTFEN